MLNTFAKLRKVTATIPLIAVLFSIFAPATTLALSAEDLHSIYNDSVWYKTGGNVSCSATTSNTNSGQKGAMYLVGDSIGNRAKSAIISSFESAGWTATVNATDGRNLPQGISAVNQDGALSAETKAVIVELGTNSSGATNANVNSMISAIKSKAPSATLYWVDTVVIDGQRTSKGNTSLASTLSRVNGYIYNSSVSPISWNKAVLGSGANPTNIDPAAKDTNGYIDASDGLGVHPTTDKGVPALAQLIVSSVKGSSQSNQSGCCSTQLSGDDGKAMVINYMLTTMGLGPIATAALGGNIQVESGFNPRSYNPSTTTDNPDPSRAFGIVQWTGGRQTSLRQLADSRSLPITDLATQLDFMSSELNGGYKDNVLDLITRTNDLANAVSVINSSYEASGTPDGPRLSAAQNILQQISSGPILGGGAGGSCSGGVVVTPSGNCNVTAPVNGSQDGSGDEYSQEQLTRIFGDPGTSASDNAAMEANLVSVNFLGTTIRAHKLVAPCLEAVAKDIAASNVNYQISQMGCYRFDSNNGVTNIGLRSYHTYGAACDINWSRNPEITGLNLSAPCSYSGASYDIPPEYVQAFYNRGFTWGGKWCSQKDYMHFEFNGIKP